MAQRKTGERKRRIETYQHTGQQRLNNPPAGLVTPATDPGAGKKTYAYDPHLDPQLVWAGNPEDISFRVCAASLHAHERLNSRTVIEAARNQNGQPRVQCWLFELSETDPRLRQAIEFHNPLSRPGPQTTASDFR